MSSGMAQTGTGKTAAFALPVLERLDVSQKTPQALVLAPTRELALQVCEAFESYASKMKGVHMLPVYGGQAYGVQLSALRRGVHVIVGTPGRIMDHLAKGTLDLSQLQYLVLDEADEMLKMGLRGRCRADPRADARREAGRPVLRDHAPADPSPRAEVTCAIRKRSASSRRPRPARTSLSGYLVVSYAQKVDALTASSRSRTSTA